MAKRLKCKLFKCDVFHFQELLLERQQKQWDKKEKKIILKLQTRDKSIEMGNNR